MKRTRRSKLAINGGTPVRKLPLPAIHNVDEREARAALRVIRRGPLSGFLGTWSPGFLGGKEVQAFEREFASHFKVRHAVACNSATTALHAAIAALEIGPGDEVIVPPFTMSASAACVLANGAVPIFADLDPKTFCLDVDSVARCITSRTKAIMVVNLFGQAADFMRLLPLAKKHKLKIIEDNAQSPGATWKGKFAGTIGDIGVFSLNIHKTIQTGEGGVLVTNNDRAALRAKLVRNHGESVIDGMSAYDAGPLFGSNYRMPEIIAAMARVQLKRLDTLTRKRRLLVQRLLKGLKHIKGISAPQVHPDNMHVFYRVALTVDETVLGISRNRLAEAMTAEGFPMTKGYVKPLYLLPLFQERRAFNTTHFPFDYKRKMPRYNQGLCPVAEHLAESTLTLTDICQHPNTTAHVDQFLRALTKIIKHKNELV